MPLPTPDDAMTDLAASHHHTVNHTAHRAITDRGHADDVRTFGFDRLVRRAIVRSSARLRLTLSSGRPPSERSFGALDRWFAGFAAEVRGHLELVQSGLLPRLGAREVLDERGLEALAADHAWVDHLLSELGDAIGVLGFDLGDAAQWVERARSIADELDLVLAGVISREQRTLVPMARAHLSAAELVELDKERRRDLVVRRVPFALAWLCETLGDDVEAEVMAAVPGPARLVYRTRRRAYARTAATALVA
ncbi:MAG: hypothetical protein ACK5OX_14270 [Desertimonas sp.]